MTSRRGDDAVHPAFRAFAAEITAALGFGQQQGKPLVCEEGLRARRNVDGWISQAATYMEGDEYRVVGQALYCGSLVMRAAQLGLCMGYCDRAGRFLRFGSLIDHLPPRATDQRYGSIPLHPTHEYLLDRVQEADGSVDSSALLHNGAVALSHLRQAGNGAVFTVVRESDADEARLGLPASRDIPHTVVTGFEAYRAAPPMLFAV